MFEMQEITEIREKRVLDYTKKKVFILRSDNINYIILIYAMTIILQEMWQPICAQ